MCSFIKIRPLGAMLLQNEGQKDRHDEANTVKPRFTNASDHEQFGLRTNFPNTKRLG